MFIAVAGAAGGGPTFSSPIKSGSAALSAAASMLNDVGRLWL
jgi:hypothetical protein